MTEKPMRDEPSGAALIEAARRALTEEVLPGLAGRPRYVALMVANALGIAARDLGEAEVLGAAGADLTGDGTGGLDALVRSIREGRRDADPALHGALVKQADIAARVWRPKGG